MKLLEIPRLLDYIDGLRAKKVSVEDLAAYQKKVEATYLTEKTFLES